MDIDRFLRLALEEDVGAGDLTSNSVVPAELQARGLLKINEPGVVSGLAVALRVFELLEPGARLKMNAKDGDFVQPGTFVGEVTARARTVLTGERVALNVLGRLSGIATLTRRFVDAVKGTNCRIADTRKTTPLLRALEKDAVRHGGGENQRFGLFDAVLVKDNHLDSVKAAGSPAGVARVTRDAREKSPPKTFIQIEARTVEEAVAAVEAGADSVLFDNFTPDRLRAAVPVVRAAARGRTVMLEGSGGVKLDTVRAFAETGVDRVSIGALTHGARSLDVGLDVLLLNT